MPDTLRNAGYTAQHWTALGPATATDVQIASFARAQGAIVLTRDLDFSAILAATRLTKPSVVHLRDQDRFEPALVLRVVMALKAFETELEAGAILTLAGNRARIRSLPL